MRLAQHIPHHALAFVAGCVYGLKETLLHHYGAFQAVFPGANPNWWNPDISWTNKGDNLLMRTVFAFLTDGYHLTAHLHLILIWPAAWVLGVVWWFGRLMNDSPSNQQMFLSALLLWATLLSAHGAGFHLVYTIIFK